MIVDITGVILVPGDHGKDCPGNGMRVDITCCCNECDYFLCCIDPEYPAICEKCKDSLTIRPW